MFNSLGMYGPLIYKVTASVIIILAALLFSGILGRLIDRLCDSKQMAPLMAGRLHRFRRVTIFSLTLLVLLEVLGVFGSAWAVISAGLAALAIGFIAAWSMLSNATAALLVLTFRPFRLGDTVELVEPNGTGLGGQVVDINLMYTTLIQQQDDGEKPPGHQFLQVPNSLFFQRVLRTRSPHAPGSKATFFS